MKTPQPLYDSLREAYIRRIVFLLLHANELCVCEFVHILQIPQPRISRYLSSLRDAGAVATRRAGNWIFYRLSEGLPPWQARILELAAVGESATAESQSDLQRLLGRPVRHAERVADGAAA